MSYLPVLLLLFVGLVIGGAVLVLTTLLGKGTFHPQKNLPFECGVPSYGDSDHRFSVRFYLVAILFLLFDVEVVFLFPWALVYRSYLNVNIFILIEVGFFFFTLLIAYFYILRKGALDWD